MVFHYKVCANCGEMDDEDWGYCIFCNGRDFKKVNFGLKDYFKFAIGIYILGFPIIFFAFILAGSMV